MNKFFKALGSEITENLKGKRSGCFVGLVACVLTIVLAFVYANVSRGIYNGAVIGYAVAGALLFLVLSLFRQTSQIAAVLLMTFDFLCLIGLAMSEGLVDYFSTQFFEGFSVAKFFELPAADWASILLIVLSLVLSSVAMYLPQNRKRAPAEGDHAGQSEQSAKEGGIK